MESDDSSRDLGIWELVIVFSTGRFFSIYRIKLFYIKFGENYFYFHHTLSDSGLFPLWS